MAHRTLMARLLSPAGFAIVILLFLAPFLTFSCSVPDGAAAVLETDLPPRVVATVDGIDLLVGGEPEVVEPKLDASVREEIGASVDGIDLEPFALLAVMVIFAGMVVGLIRDHLARHAASIGLAVLAAALLVGALLRVGHTFDERLADDELDLGMPIPHSTSPAIGFWLMMGLLAALVVGNAVALVRLWRVPVDPPPP